MTGVPPDLSTLPSNQWRCLRVVSVYSDIAHAARRLHWSQVALKAMLSDLTISLGFQHIHVESDQVHVSETLKSVIEHPRPPKMSGNSVLRPDAMPDESEQSFRPAGSSAQIAG